MTEEDLGGYEFEDGEDTREVGERLAASYVNFYISNGGVVVPQFGDEHDKTAVEILGTVFPEERSVRSRPGIFFSEAEISTASHSRSRREDRKDTTGGNTKCER